MLGNNLPLRQIWHNPIVDMYFFPSCPQLGQVGDFLHNNLGRIGDIHVDTLILAWTSMAIILILSALVAPALKSDGPGGKGQALLEGLYSFMEDICHGQMGHAYQKFFPLITAIFTFVLIGNFIGVLVPWKWIQELLEHAGMEFPKGFEFCSPTTDFNVTFGLATISLLVYLGSGLWAHGFKYIKGYWNPIEWMDLIIRPATLSLRLMMVITADELMRGAALTMVPVLLPTGVMGFELFIGIIQAFVFCLLTSIYIGLTVSHQ